MFTAHNSLDFFTGARPGIQNRLLCFPAQVSPSLGAVTGSQRHRKGVAVLIKGSNSHDGSRVTTLYTIRRRFNSAMGIIIPVKCPPGGRTCVRRIHRTKLRLFDRRGLRVLDRGLRFSTCLTLLHRYSLNCFVFTHRRNVNALYLLVRTNVPYILGQRGPF